MGFHMRPSLWLACASVSVLLQGCANLNSIYREFNIGRGDKPTKSITMDVKQRTVLSSVIQSKVMDLGVIEKTVICAEPSPDALSVYAAGLSGSVYSGDKKAAELALSSSETGSFIGNRTVTIQLLRDNLYRACEGYMSGALNEDQYYTLIRRYQVMTMGLLAIEHLTETVKPPSVTITAGAAGASQGGGPDAINKAADVKAKANAQLAGSKESRDTLKDALTKAEQEAADAPKDAELKKKAEDAKKSYQKAQTQFRIDEDKAKTATELFEEAKGGSGMRTRVSGGSLLSSSSPAAAAAHAAAAASVAATAKEIVKMTIDEGFKLDDCLTGDGSCFNDTQKTAAIKVAQMSCEDKASNKFEYVACVAPIVGLFKLSIEDTLAFIQSAGGKNDQFAPAGQVNAESAKKSDFFAFAKALTPADAISSLYRLDVFFTNADDSALKAIRSSAIRDEFSAVRYRAISSADCENKFQISPNDVATVRYDGSEQEVRVKDRLVSVLKGFRPPILAKEQSVITPTPLYISIFLCKK
jgi:hypothetical protein